MIYNPNLTVIIYRDKFISMLDRGAKISTLTERKSDTTGDKAASDQSVRNLYYASRQDVVRRQREIIRATFCKFKF